MPQEWAIAAGVAGWLLTVSGALTVTWKAVRATVKAERTVTEEVPSLREQLAAHDKQDDQRFDSMEALLNRIDRKLDVACNDINWLKRQQNGGR